MHTYQLLKGWISVYRFPRCAAALTENRLHANLGTYSTLCILACFESLNLKHTSDPNNQVQLPSHLLAQSFPTFNSYEAGVSGMSCDKLHPILRPLLLILRGSSHRKCMLTLIFASKLLHCRGLFLKATLLKPTSLQSLPKYHHYVDHRKNCTSIHQQGYAVRQDLNLKWTCCTINGATWYWNGMNFKEGFS